MTANTKTVVSHSPLAEFWQERPTLRFILARSVRAVVSLFVIVTVAFLALHLAPGDPVREAMGATASAESVDARRELLGLNDPLWTQFFHYLVGLFQGNLGYSYVTGQPVSAYVGARVPYTLILGVIALSVVLLISIPLGMTVAVLTNGDRRHRLDALFGSITGFFAALPDYLLAVSLVVVFGLAWRVLPVAGAGQPLSYILPSAALALPAIAVLSRIARVEMARTLGQDYILTARYKRLRPSTIYVRHALPNALTAVFTVGGTIFATLVTATALVETVFNWPGLGVALVSAISSRDYAIVLGIALVYGVTIIAIHATVDLVLGLVQTRRNGGGRR